MKKQILITALLLTALPMHMSWAQGIPAEQVESAADTIEERANQARLAERAKAAPQQTAPMSAPLNMAPVRQKPPVAEYALVALRGWSNSLEATLMINGKRVTGSLKYPTLTDGWRLQDVTQNGAVIVKAKERRELAFVGPEPYEIPKAAGISGQVLQPAGTPILPTR